MAKEAQKRQRLWTFVVRGDRPLRIAFPSNPLLEHDGEGTSIWKFTGDLETAWQLMNIATRLGCVVESYTDIQFGSVPDGSEVSFETERCQGVIFSIL